MRLETSNPPIQSRQHTLQQRKSRASKVLLWLLIMLAASALFLEWLGTIYDTQLSTVAIAATRVALPCGMPSQFRLDLPQSVQAEMNDICDHPTDVMETIP